MESFGQCNPGDGDLRSVGTPATVDILSEARASSAVKTPSADNASPAITTWSAEPGLSGAQAVFTDRQPSRARNIDKSKGRNFICSGLDNNINQLAAKINAYNYFKILWVIHILIARFAVAFGS